jgi:hypothetical protein
MTKALQDYEKIAAACAKAATEAKSLGDREQLLQMHKRYLELAEKEGAADPTPQASRQRRSPTMFK